MTNKVLEGTSLLCKQDWPYRDEGEPIYVLRSYVLPYEQIMRKAGIKKGTWGQYEFPVDSAPSEITKIATEDTGFERRARVRHFAELDKSIKFEMEKETGGLASKMPRFLTQSDAFGCEVSIVVHSLTSVTVRAEKATINRVPVSITKTYAINEKDGYWTRSAYSNVSRRNTQDWKKGVSGSACDLADYECARIFRAFLHSHSEHLRAGEVSRICEINKALLKKNAKLRLEIEKNEEEIVKNVDIMWAIEALVHKREEEKEE